MQTISGVAPLALLMCTTAVAQADSPVDKQPRRSNVLILIADDLGVDYIGAYKEGADPAPTPNIDALAERGVLFRNAWASPLCSPTRACMMTGRYSFRTGVGTVIAGGGRGRRGRGAASGAGANNPRGVLRAAELTLPELLDLGRSGYAHAAIGKWHLGLRTEPRGPNEAGWSHYSGMIPGQVRDYFGWPRTVDGETSTSANYTTTQLVDDALAWIRGVEGQQKPWLCYLSFNAPHSPFHRPPRQLFTEDPNQPVSRDDPVACYKAMVEAMDTEIGRLLRALGPSLARTNIIFIGDNGTPRQVVQKPFLHYRAKGSIYEGGVNVPLIVAGPAVNAPRRESVALVSATDIFATVAELCGVKVRAVAPRDLQIDGVSFVPHLSDPDHPPVRTTVFTELFRGDRPDQTGVAAIRDARYKLVRHFRHPAPPRDQFYDLEKDPFETRSLVRREKTADQTERLRALRAELERLRASAGNGK